MKAKSSARTGAVSITTKTGIRVVLRATNPQVYVPRLRYLVDDQFHECDFEGTKIDDSGVSAEICACGRTRYRL